MKRTVVRLPFALALVALLLLLGVALATPQEVVAFQHGWFPFVSLNVGAAERGLWDDIAAGSPPGEAGLLWFVNNAALDETVGYKTTQVAVSTSSFPRLWARAALSDNATFRVGYALDNAVACSYPAALIWGPADDDGLYRIKSALLPAGHVVRGICILLTDEPNGVAIGRSNVLIDYIALRNAAGGWGWIENFIGAP